jgi:hypothetical protein
VVLSCRDSTQEQRRSISQHLHGQTTGLSSRIRDSKSRSTDTTTRTLLDSTLRVWWQILRVPQRTVFSCSTHARTTLLVLIQLQSNGGKLVTLLRLVNTMLSSIWHTKVLHQVTLIPMLMLCDTLSSRVTTRALPNPSPRTW